MGKLTSANKIFQSMDRKTRMIILLCFLLGMTNLKAQIITYDVPQEINDTNKFVRPSGEYKVELSLDGQTFVPFVYEMPAMHVTNNSKTTAWCNFSFSGKIQVKVTPLNQKPELINILPKSAGINAIIKNGSAVFTISKPGHYSVEFEEGIYIEHPLFIFANPLEENPPQPNQKDVIYFEPGYHEIGEKYTVPSGKTVYIHGGAFVKGQIYSENSENITIRGRGILSGEEYPPRTADHMIMMRNAENIKIEGITIIHAPRYNITLRGKNHIVSNVKMMGWWFSTDGTSTGDNAIIENCFFKVNDDAVKLYSSNTYVRDCVIWQMENGAPFMISWNGRNDFENCYVSDIDVIRVEHQWDNENLAVICAIHGGEAHISHFLFDNIRISNSNWRIFHLVTRPNRWGKWNPEKGSISDMTFKNITYDGSPRIKNLIMGHDSNHPIYNLTFQNITIDGNIVSSRNQEEYFIIDDENTKNINFKTP
ncbi:glycosyl hydrolase family 28 protein [Thermophagus sp. OGC60D27]|uniref:glycosyl hydrolase family 28 protein n=1 Tax=Thermophagus sp. OGC60D27 TaxID=3458415 RepID=UPI004037EC91